MDPFKLVPASYFPYIISALFTALTGLAGWVVRKLFKAAAVELKTAKDSLTKLNKWGVASCTYREQSAAWSGNFRCQTLSSPC